MRSTYSPRKLRNYSLLALAMLLSGMTGCSSMGCHDPCTPCYDACTPCVPAACVPAPCNPYCVELAVPSLFHPMMPGYYNSCDPCCNTCASPPGRIYPKRPNMMTRTTFRPDLCRPTHRRNRCVEDYCVEDQCIGNGCVEMPSCVAPPDCGAPVTCALPGYQASVGYQGVPQAASYNQVAMIPSEPRRLSIDVPPPVSGRFPEPGKTSAKILVNESAQEMEFLPPIHSKNDTAIPMLPIESGRQSQLKSPQRKPANSSPEATEGDSAQGPPLVPPAA